MKKKTKIEKMGTKCLYEMVRTYIRGEHTLGGWTNGIVYPPSCPSSIYGQVFIEYNRRTGLTFEQMLDKIK